MSRAFRVMSVSVAVVMALGMVAFAPAAQATPPGEVSARGTAGPAGFVDSPEDFFYWEERESSADCPGGPWCEIDGSAFWVPRGNADWLYAVATTTYPADPALPTRRDAGVGLYIDTNSDGNADYATVAPAVYFQPGISNRQFAPVLRREGSGWADTGAYSYWYFDPYGWGVQLEWRRAGIMKASFSMVLCEAAGCDYAPTAGTPQIDIKTFVDGPVPGKASALTVTYFPRKGGKVAAKVQWAYTGPGTPITRWYFRASGDNGRTWTTWKWTSGTATSVNVTGLRKGKRGLFEIYAQNAVGNGPTTRLTLTP